MKSVNYFRTFLEDKNVASLTPTSHFVVKDLCKSIDFAKDSVIVEYGPGTGVFTKFILKNTTPDSRLIAIETNPRFVGLLENLNDQRLTIVNDKAENIKKVLRNLGIKKIDYLISGIPFSYIKDEIKSKLIKDSYDSLSEEGKFLIYQYSLHIKKYLKDYFNSINSRIQILNFPTMFIMEAVK